MFMCVFHRRPLIRWITSTASCCFIRIRCWGRPSSLGKRWSISPPTRNRSVINWPWRRPKVHMLHICINPRYSFFCGAVSILSFVMFWVNRRAAVESGTIWGGSGCVQTTAGKKSRELGLLPWPGESPQAWYKILQRCDLSVDCRSWCYYNMHISNII